MLEVYRDQHETIQVDMYIYIDYSCWKNTRWWKSLIIMSQLKIMKELDYVHFCKKKRKKDIWSTRLDSESSVSSPGCQETKTLALLPICDTSMSLLLKHSMSLFSVTTASVNPLVMTNIEIAGFPITSMVMFQLAMYQITGGYLVWNGSQAALPEKRLCTA